MPSVIPGCVSAATFDVVFSLHRILVAQQLGEAEVHDLHVAPLGQENVCGLDVAMHDALRVRGVKGVGDLDAEIDNLVDLERAAGDAIVEVLALHPLHHDEWLALVLTDVVHRADVGMVQCGGGPRFDAKPFNGLAISDEIFGDEFESDLAAKTGVVSAVNDAHTAGAELADHSIMRNCFADHAQGCACDGSHSPDDTLHPSLHGTHFHKSFRMKGLTGRYHR